MKLRCIFAHDWRPAGWLSPAPDGGIRCVWWCLSCNRTMIEDSRDPWTADHPLDLMADLGHHRDDPDVQTAIRCAEAEADLKAANALIVRYWCGDGPEGSGAIADIKAHVLALPKGEHAALAAAIEDEQVSAWLDVRASSS